MYQSSSINMPSEMKLSSIEQNHQFLHLDLYQSLTPLYFLIECFNPLTRTFSIVCSR